MTTNAGNTRGLKARLRSLTDSRFLEIVLSLLGGLAIAILAALIMKYV